MECKFNKSRRVSNSEVKIGDHIIPQVPRFKYLGSVIQDDGEIEGDVNHRIQAGWMKWRKASGVLCDAKVPIKLKGKFYRTAVRPAILYGTECWAVKSQHENKVGVDEGLKKLKKSAVDGDINESIDDESNKASERGKGIERLSAISDLMEKINKARTEEDLKPCLEMKTQLFNLDEGASVKDLQDNEMHENETVVTDVVPAEGLDYSLPKFVTTTEIDLETLNTIDKHFSTQDIEQL